MADSNIGALPQAPRLDDDSLLVAEQQGQAVKVTGAQFKEFGRQAVVGQVQSYVDAAEAAADRAADAVDAVTGMTVEASTLPSGQSAAVTKTTQNGKVHLVFGLPRGEPGIPGPDGPAGPRGARGETGKGLTILGYYDTLQALEAAVTAPDAGDAYGVGAEAPYDIYVFDGTALAWRNNGPLSGGGGIVPEDVVTSEGGASLEIPDSFGGTPHAIQFTDEEEPPLTAGDIEYGDATVQEALDGLKSSVSDGKALIASAITDKGVDTAQDASFAGMAEHIGQIAGGTDTSDATAAAGDILAGKTAYTAAGKTEGTIPTLPARTYTPGTAAQVIASGQYLGGAQTIQGDPNLTSSNIKKGVSIFGVAGAVEQSFLATLTVTADVGAVVTAAHSGGTEVEALSTTGTVTMELPLEGQWTVTARRGVAQYNSVVVTVTSQYNAALTAEVHIEYYGVAVPLSVARCNLAAASIGSYVLFGGGIGGGESRITVDAYNSDFVHSTPEVFSNYGTCEAATSVDDFALFPIYSDDGRLDAYDRELVHYVGTSGLRKISGNAATSIGGYALFGGGWTGSEAISVVDSFDNNLSQSTTKTPLQIQAYNLSAASNDNYAIFAGGTNRTESLPYVTAYDKSLVRSTPTSLSEARESLAAARAGNYVLFAGGQVAKNMTVSKSANAVEAYDLFLTRTTVSEALSVARGSLAATTVKDYALFGGGVELGQVLCDAVDVYDPYLVRTSPQSLSVSRTYLAAGTVGGSALFGGGRKGSSTVYYDAVDIYRYV